MLEVGCATGYYATRFAGRCREYVGVDLYPPHTEIFRQKIGVLRAMGMKKHKVALGLWLEMLIITALCLAIGFGIGAVAAQPVSDELLAGQIESAKAAVTQQPSFTRGIALGGPVQQELVPLEQVDVSVGMDTIIEIAIISLLLASLASLVAITKITKYEPIKILMERS